MTGIIPEGVERETPSADELLGEVPDENLMEEKMLIRVDQRGKTLMRKNLKGKSLVMVVMVTKEGNSLMTLMRRRY